MIRKLGMALMLVSLLNSCIKDPKEPVDYMVKDEEIIQAYFEANNITDTIADPSGVYIQHITEGTGATPTLSDNISVKYELYNLPEDERVPQTEDPITFNLSGLIYGWQIGIPYMKEGGEAYLYIPRAYAYGDGVLKFKIELIEIVE